MSRPTRWPAPHRPPGGGGRHRLFLRLWRQPALIAELVDWARTAGFPRGLRRQGHQVPAVYHASTPDTVWGHYGFTEEQVAGGDFNRQMFNSFLDGTKSALEMAAVANACDLTPPPAGLAFPACGVDDLPTLLRPQSAAASCRWTAPSR